MSSTKRYYYGKIAYHSDDGCSDSITPNNTIFESKDECFLDLVTHLPAFMDDLYDEGVPTDLEEGLDDSLTWEQYFSKFPITNENELNSFLDKIKDDCSYVSFKIEELFISSSGNKRSSEGSRDNEGPLKKTKSN